MPPRAGSLPSRSSPKTPVRPHIDPKEFVCV
jgi:hypothetical protein